MHARQMHRLFRLSAGIHDGDGLRGRNDHITNHRFDVRGHRPVHTLRNRLRSRTHLCPVSQHITPPCGDVFRGLALFRIEHDATRFTADMDDALHEPLILRNINHGFGISGDHTVIRYNHNQCAFGYAAAEKAKLTVNTLVCANPFVGIPTVVMPDLIGITQIQVCQSGIFRRLGRDCDTLARIIVGNVVTATQGSLRQRGKREFRQSRTGHTNALCA